MKNGSAPINSAAATMRPQSAIGIGFFHTVPDGSRDRYERAGVAVEEQRKRNDADGQRNGGKAEADETTSADQ